MADKRRPKKKDPKRFGPRVHGALRAPMTQAGRIDDAALCKQLEEVLEKELRDRCQKKEFDDESANCTTGGGAAAPVDLVVLIDTSGSMSDEATDLSNAADAAIQAAAQSCPSDLRVAWFGIEGTWTGTNFTRSYRDYLNNDLGVGNGDIVGTPGDFEDGAAAVIDIADHFDWRPGAARAIFYLGDEALEGGDPQNADDVAAANAAIAAAGGVKVFTYFGTPFGATPNPTTVSEYARLATETGGQAFVAPLDSIGGFQVVLEGIICASNDKPCREIEEPDVVPCFRLRWGDGPDDRIETDDTEILCITVCNPYSNVVLRDFTLSLALIPPGGGLIPTLPDGTPSVEIRPEFLVCYGDIGPCDPKDPKKNSCISREFMLRSRGAQAGEYGVFLVYCFDACFAKLGFGETFRLQLVES